MNYSNRIDASEKTKQHMKFVKYMEKRERSQNIIELNLTDDEKQKLKQHTGIITKLKKTELGEMIILSNKLNQKIYNFYYDIGSRCNMHILDVNTNDEKTYFDNFNSNAITKDFLLLNTIMKLRIHDDNTNQNTKQHIETVKKMKNSEMGEIGEITEKSNILNLKVYNSYNNIDIEYTTASIISKYGNISIKDANEYLRDFLRSSTIIKLLIHNEDLFNVYIHKQQESVCIKKLKIEKDLFFV